MDLDWHGLEGGRGVVGGRRDAFGRAWLVGVLRDEE